MLYRRLTDSRLLFVLAAILACSAMAGCTKNRPWDYVALGDSTPAGYGVDKSYVDYYGEFIEEDLDVQVEIHNFSQSGQTTGTLLKKLRDNEDLREAIREAKVITIWTGWNDLAKPLSQYREETCGGKDNLDCIRNAVVALNTNVDAILDEILSLTNPQDTLIRVADVGIPFVNTWTYQGWFETLQVPCYEVWREHLVDACQDRGITVVYTYHILNGPNGDEKMEGIFQNDGIHFNTKGHKLIATLHREAGYTYTP